MNKIFIYIICLILCACSSGKKDGIIIIDSFQETSNSHILEDFFDSLTVTPLVFDGHFYDNMLLTYKDCGDYFTIQDWNKSIKVFDKNGKIRTNISAQGRGPGEYRVIDDFDITQDNKIKVLCNHDKLITYSLDGEYLYEAMLDFPANNFTLYQDSSYVFWSPRDSQSEYGINRIFVTNKDLEVTNTFLPLDMHAVAYGTAMVSTEGGNKILCRQYNDPNIYIIDNMSVICTYHVDFKNKNLPATFTNALNMDIAAEEMEKMQAYFISTAYENEKTIMMTIVYQDKLDSSKGAYWLIDKETNSSKLSYFDITDEEFELLGYPLYLTESNELIFIVDKDRYNNLKIKYPILLSDIDDFNSSYLLLKFYI